MEPPSSDTLRLKSVVLPSSWDELVVHSLSDGGGSEIVGLREMNVSLAILTNNLDLLTSTISEGEVHLSLLDLTVRFGHAEFASRLASLGIGFRGLSKYDFQLWHHSASRDEDIAGLFLPAVHAAIRATQMDPSLTGFLWTNELPLLRMLLVESEFLEGSQTASSYASQVAKLSIHLHPRLLVDQLASGSWEDTNAHLKLLMDAGVDMCKLPTWFQKNDIELSVLDFAILEGGDEDTLLRLISAGVQSAQGVNIGVFLVTGMEWLAASNRPSLNFEAIQVMASAGIDLGPLCVDLDMLATLRRGRFAGGRHGKWSMLRVAIMLGQPFGAITCCAI